METNRFFGYYTEVLYDFPAVFVFRKMNMNMFLLSSLSNMIINSASRWVGDDGSVGKWSVLRWSLGRCTLVKVYFVILILIFFYIDDKEETTKQNKEKNKSRAYWNFIKYFFYL